MAQQPSVRELLLVSQLGAQEREEVCSLVQIQVAPSQEVLRQVRAHYYSSGLLPKALHARFRQPAFLLGLLLGSTLFGRLRKLVELLFNYF